MATKKKSAAPKSKAPLVGAKLVEAVRSRLSHISFKWTPRRWLDTGSAELNGVLGDPEKGIPYGKIIELSGENSNGKTAIAMDLMAAAQADGAFGIWVDFENSFDPEWAGKRGVDTENICIISPMVGQFGKEKERRLSTAEEMLMEAEQVMLTLHKQFPDTPMFLVGDSIAAMLVAEEAEAGLDGQNMKSKMGLPSMLGGLLRRWTGLLQVYNCTACFINQLRINPMAWGDPTYTPGGKALPFYAHVRVRLKRAKGKGRILKAGKMIGIRGTLRNDKNKAGGIEGEVCGFKMYFDGRSAFLPASEVEDQE